MPATEAGSADAAVAEGEVPLIEAGSADAALDEGAERKAPRPRHAEHAAPDLVISAEGARPAAPPAKHPEGAHATRAELRRARQRELPELRRSRLFVLFVIVLCLAVVAAAVAIAVRVRLGNGQPAATVAVTLPHTMSVPGTPPSIPWPLTGQAAVAIPAAGYAAQSGPEHPAPVASLAKIMTAYIVLRDHPLGIFDNGPAVTMTAFDVAFFNQDSAGGQSALPVAQGEVLTERQLVDGMLVRSANNLAQTLADWDAGSETAFVAKMNATAKALAMHDTHFEDSSGVSPLTVSTPSDLLKVSSRAMALPAFAQAVAMPNVTLPVGGTLDSFTPELGTPGVVGVKSGFTSEAGSCDVLALERVVGLKPVLILVAVTGQPGSDASGGAIALGLAAAAAPGVVAVPVIAQGMHVATASVSAGSTPVAATRGASVVGWPATVILQGVTVTNRPVAGSPAGTRVGVARFAVGTQIVTVPVHTIAALPRLTVLQRLF